MRRATPTGSTSTAPCAGCSARGEAMSGGSFEAFVAERSTELLRTGYLLTNDRVQARDLLQTALMAAYRHRDEPTDPTAQARRALVGAHTGWQRRLRVGDLLAESPPMAGTTRLPGVGTRTPPHPRPRAPPTPPPAAPPPPPRAAPVPPPRVGPP